MNLTTLNNQALISLAPLNATTVLIGYYDYHLMTLFFICFISFQREKRARDYLKHIYNIIVQPADIGWPTGNGKKLSNTQACCLAQLCLNAALFLSI